MNSSPERLVDERADLRLPQDVQGRRPADAKGRRERDQPDGQQPDQGEVRRQGQQRPELWVRPPHRDEREQPAQDQVHLRPRLPVGVIAPAHQECEADGAYLVRFRRQ